MSEREAAERLKSNDQDYWFAIDKLPDAAADARLVADAYLAIADEVTPEVSEAVCRWSADDYGFDHGLGRKDSETLIDFALAVIERVG